MTASVAGAAIAVLILVLTVELVRRRQLREKYAALWLVVSALAVVLALVPGVLVWVATTLGFGIPANLLFFAGFILLLVVSMHLSLELGRREGETERLAEELALLRHALDRLEERLDAKEEGPPRPDPDE
jgi:hypothetical protein